jgi:hypothetical protein
MTEMYIIILSVSYVQRLTRMVLFLIRLISRLIETFEVNATSLSGKLNPWNLLQPIKIICYIIYFGRG